MARDEISREGADRLPTVAALFVESGGCYFGLPGVDPWDIARDARLYRGPYPAVAHPPCARWGRYWNGGPSARVPRRLGDDGGCFAAALAAVERWGGVLEHPEGSHAWRAFNIVSPPRNGRWVPAGIFHPGAWTCCVEQGWYGHPARKATWLFAYGVELPELKWGSAPGDFVGLDEGFHSARKRQIWRETGNANPYIRRAVKTGACQRLSKRQRAATPIPFRDALLSIARSASSPAEGRQPSAAGPLAAPPLPGRAADVVQEIKGSAVAIHAHEHDDGAAPCPYIRSVGGA